VLSALSKYELSHLPVSLILVCRYGVSALLFIPWLMYHRFKSASFHLRAVSLKMHIARTILAVLSVYLYVAALKHISITMATLLFNLMPLFVPLITYVWKKVPINHTLWWGFSVSLIGVFWVLTPIELAWNKDVLLAIGSGLAGASSLVVVRYAHFEDDSYRINFYFFLMAFFITVLFSFFSWDEIKLNFTREDVLPLFLIGLTGMLYQQSFAFSLKHAPARLLAPFMYSSVIWAVFLDQWLWKASLTFSMALGMALIVLGNILIYILYPKHQI
jgi:drug/metabolite transporter (DMT)-like permease